LYSSPDNIEVMNEDVVGGTCSTYGGSEKRVHNNYVGRPECRRSFVRSWHIWVEDIKMDLKEMRYDGVDWI
jgi:hypothetical protein